MSCSGTSTQRPQRLLSLLMADTLLAPTVNQEDSAAKGAYRAWGQALLLLVTVGLAFWFSLASTVEAGLDSPMGLAPAGVPLALLAAVCAYRRDTRAAPSRDTFLDVIGGLVLAIAAIALVWSGPDAGWSFWSDRLDLLALELFFVAAACWIFGLATVWRYRSGLLVLAIASPEVLGWLDSHLAPTLASITSVIARPGAELFGVRLSANTPATSFIGVNRLGQSYNIVIANVCSGINSWLSVVLVGIPAASYLGLERRRLAGWLAFGVCLAFLANLLRVVVLLVATDRLGVDFALGELHPLLGLVLISVVFLVLFFGTRRRRVPERPGWQARRLRVASVLLLFPFTMAGALGQVGLLPYASLPASGSGPQVQAPLDIVPRLSGWTTKVIDEISWQNLFGPSSRSLALTYSEPTQPVVTMQLVTTPDKAKLLTYTPERCGIYHGGQVRGQKTVDLGLGQVGFLVDASDTVPLDLAHPNNGQTRSLLFNIVYWYVPFSVGDNRWFARFTLILDADADSQLPALAPSQRGFSPGGPAFSQVDLALVSMARGMVTRLVTG